VYLSSLTAPQIQSFNHVPGILNGWSWLLTFSLPPCQCSNSSNFSSILEIPSSTWPNLLVMLCHPLPQFFIWFIEQLISKISIFPTISISLLNYSTKSWTEFLLYLSGLFGVIVYFYNSNIGSGEGCGGSSLSLFWLSFPTVQVDAICWVRASPLKSVWSASRLHSL
jgi:hypothetical protein